MAVTPTNSNCLGVLFYSPVKCTGAPKYGYFGALHRWI